LYENNVSAATEKFVVKGQYDKALEAFEQIIRADATDTKALNRAADLYLKKNENTKGIETLSRLGECYTKDGFYSKAVAIYKRILKIDTAGTKESLVAVHEKLAELYGQLGLISDAMSHFSIVVDVFDRTGDQEALLRALKKVSDLDPYNIDSQLKLIELFVAQDKIPDAQEAFERLAEHVNAKGHMPDVLRVYERWVESFPTDYLRLKDLVDQYIRVGEPKKALARIQLAFKANPREAAVLELLSMTFLSLNQADKAKAVDVELLKIYRQAEDKVQAAEVEERLKGKVPKVEVGAAKEIERSPLNEAIDPGDALIQSLTLDPDERKILSECDVYSKYGLNDKAFEVLSASLSKFGQSIALRWKLKAVCSDRQDTEMASHLLSEIVLLAKSKNLKNWEVMASAALEEMDPRHPAISKKSELRHDTGGSLEVLEDSAEIPPPPGENFKDFEPSEISIVLDEEVSEFQQVESTPAAMTAPIPPDEVPASAEDFMAASADDANEEPEPLLTESDFSDEELQKLSASLDSNVDSTMGDSAPLELSSEVVVDADFEIRQALDEVEFFKQQGLQTEAHHLLKSLETKYPGNPLLVTDKSKPVVDKLKKNTLEIEALGRKVRLSVQEDHRSSEDENFFDLGAALDEELKDAPKFDGPSEVRDVFAAFKQGVAQVVNEDDWQTHFDLGVAYREMGLIEDSIQEFLIVLKTEGQKSSALYQLGVCEVARGGHKKAKDYFDQALQLPNLLQQEKISISYELADALLHLNDKARAKKLFEEIQSADPEFREVTLKIQSLAS